LDLLPPPLYCCGCWVAWHSAWCASLGLCMHFSCTCLPPATSCHSGMPVSLGVLILQVHCLLGPLMPPACLGACKIILCLGICLHMGSGLLLGYMLDLCCYNTYTPAAIWVYRAAAPRHLLDAYAAWVGFWDATCLPPPCRGLPLLNLLRISYLTAIPISACLPPAGTVRCFWLHLHRLPPAWMPACLPGFVGLGACLPAGPPPACRDASIASPPYRLLVRHLPSYRWCFLGTWVLHLPAGYLGYLYGYVMPGFSGFFILGTSYTGLYKTCTVDCLLPFPACTSCLPARFLEHPACWNLTAVSFLQLHCFFPTPYTAYIDLLPASFLGTAGFLRFSLVALPHLLPAASLSTCLPLGSRLPQVPLAGVLGFSACLPFRLRCTTLLPAAIACQVRRLPPQTCVLGLFPMNRSAFSRVFSCIP